MSSTASRVPQLRIPINPGLWLRLAEDHRVNLAESDEPNAPARLAAFDNRRVSLWPYLTDGAGLLHPDWRASGWSSRCTASRPAIQQLPTQLRAAVQEPGRTILCADWSSAHPTILALESGDETMLDDIQQNDAYSWLAEAAATGAPTDIGRKAAKRAVMAWINGGSAGRIDADWTAATDEPIADDIRGLIEARWPVAAAWLVGMKQEITDADYRFVVNGVVHSAPENDRLSGKAGYKAAGAMVQAVEADSLRSVLAQLDDDLCIPGLDCRLIITMYDETVWSCAPDDLDAAAGWVRAAMATALLQDDADAFPNAVTVTYGPSWCRQDGTAEPATGKLLGPSAWAATAIGRLISTKNANDADKDDLVEATRGLLADADWRYGAACAWRVQTGEMKAAVASVNGLDGGTTACRAIKATQAEAQNASAWVRSLYAPTLEGVEVDIASPLRVARAFMAQVETEWRLNRWSGQIVGADGKEMPEPEATEIRCKIDDDYGVAVRKDEMWDAIEAAAANRSFDPVSEHLGSLVWDGTPRIDDWLIKTIGCDDTPLHRAYSRRFMLTLCVRATQPGEKVDHVLIVIDPEHGVGKSTMWRDLLWDESLFSDDRVDFSNPKAVAEIIKGVLILEIAELASVRAADVDLLKQALSQQSDRFRAAYARKAHSQPRSVVFVGTTNETEFLKADTAQRRFWPVQSAGIINRAWLRENRDQLWAEAMAAHAAARSDGNRYERYWIDPEHDPELFEAQRASASDREVTDPMVETLTAWGVRHAGRKNTLADILLGALEVRTADLSKHSYVGKKLRKAGYAAERVVRDGAKTTVYVYPAEVIDLEEAKAGRQTA